MKYILMCGGDYQHWDKPRHLSVVNGEEVIARTIRLLKENGVKDISISTENPIFEKFNLPILKHENSYKMKWHKMEGNWCDAFYPTDEPVCYILGDVYFSEEAIKKIVKTEIDDIELFGSMPPFAENYMKDHIEAFALKVQNIEHFKKALQKTRELDKQGKFWRSPIIWELWTVIKDVPLQTKPDDYIYNYIKINDYTCDIDWEEDIKKMEYYLKGGYKMVKVEVIKEFTLAKFDELKNIKRKSIETYGKLYVGDTFECNKEMADYLLGDNDKGFTVVKVIEIVPEPVKSIINTKVENENIEPLKEEKIEKVKKETKKVTTPKKKRASKK